MQLRLLRFSSGLESTLGVLHLLPATFLCFTLEDEFRTQKVYARTRIPDGVYNLKLREHGGHHERYTRKFSFHIGMLELENVAGFTDVLIHIGNKDDDTAGCILTGDTCQQNITEDGFIGGSASAYRRIYPGIANALDSSEPVTLSIDTLA